MANYTIIYIHFFIIIKWYNLLVKTCLLCFLCYEYNRGLRDLLQWSLHFLIYIFHNYHSIFGIGCIQWNVTRLKKYIFILLFIQKNLLWNFFWWLLLHTRICAHILHDYETRLTSWTAHSALNHNPLTGHTHLFLPFFCLTHGVFPIYRGLTNVWSSRTTQWRQDKTR